jgi:ATP-dependent protease HslVU (ClpYQ) peptidase subunit
MTCIVGIEHEGGVTIGADSAGSNYAITVSRADSKLFKVGDYLIGFTSSFRMGQLLHYAFTPTAPNLADLDKHMCTTFIDEIRTCLKTGGYASKHNEVETGGTFLVGVAGRLFCVEGDYQVGHTFDGYSACGSGEYVALGALHALDQYDLTPRQKCLAALQAASTFDPYVGGPFQVQTIRSKS